MVQDLFVKNETAASSNPNRRSVYFLKIKYILVDIDLIL